MLPLKTRDVWTRQGSHAAKRMFYLLDGKELQKTLRAKCPGNRADCYVASFHCRGKGLEGKTKTISSYDNYEGHKGMMVDHLKFSGAPEPQHSEMCGRQWERGARWATSCLRVQAK